MQIWQKKGNWRYGTNGILNVATVEANLKMLTHWYLVPTRLAKMYPSVSPLCFRGCQMLRTMWHIWWKCHRICGFWNSVFALIRKVTGQSVPQTPFIELLNAQYLVYLCATSDIFYFTGGAKMTLPKSWKQPTVSLAQARQNVTWIMLHENIVSILKDRVKQLEQTWEPWAALKTHPICIYCMWAQPYGTYIKV